MLNGFRALGGVAENICSGSAGTGLYAIDPTLPVSLGVPPNLCFSLADIEFADGAMGLKPTANVGAGERKFFETYAHAFSWGAGGEGQSAKFLATLAALPPEVRDVLKNEFQMAGVFDGDPAERTQAWFLRSRRFRVMGRDCLVPILELARHGADGLAPVSDVHGWLQITGKVAGEISVPRGPYDTLGVFWNFGAVSPQHQAYSLPLTIKGKDTDIVIGRNASNALKRGAFLVPYVDSGERAVTFSYLMIGHSKLPRLSRGIFAELARDAHLNRPDQAFDQVLFLNRMKYLKLIGALEPHEGDAVMTLRRVAHTQLERISHCIGTRAL